MNRSRSVANSTVRKTTISLISLAAMALPLAVSPALAGGAAPPVTAKDAGARYGQALGALEICHGSKLTDKAKAMGDAYQGTDHEAFKAQAAKVYQAWHAVKTCANQRDPNQCKIIMDKSCETAEAEIGAAGKIMPGLVEFLKR